MFCHQQLCKQQPRDDYRELLELTIIYLSGTPPRRIRFMKPGAINRARWMARVIYAIKIVLFKSQFHMTRREATGMKIFAIGLYVLACMIVPVAASAPSYALELIK